MCVEAGVRSTEHGNLLDEPTAKLMGENGTFRVPTLVTYEKLHSQGARYGVAKESLTKLARIIEAGLESLAIAADAGVRIASGVDLRGPMRGYQGEEIAIKARAVGAMGAIIAPPVRTLALRPRAGDRHNRGRKAGRSRRGRRRRARGPGLLGRDGGVVLVVLGGRVAHNRLG